ncbi:hypothetical protein HELRODRAFT_158781 [Helobdella robusta]|uniref:Dedicator of cytokinesis protein 7 n=1 Tax=Helobdella robusta TaxID=6412 RepID=T1EN92_HELRO|nr:hypothetical protein HELRODRAFT_158781 [Helobdella robusta]ESO12296.1 hypothetical protein HELRODRAFT_158781 [Helobdella robusta]
MVKGVQKTLTEAYEIKEKEIYLSKFCECEIEDDEYIQGVLYGDVGFFLYTVRKTMERWKMVPFTDLVDPPDVEEYLSAHQTLIERDPLYQLLEFPSDDYQALVVKKKIRTVDPVVPEKGADSEKHVRDCLRLYNKDYNVIQKKYEHCNNFHNDKVERASIVKMTSSPQFESSQQIDNLPSKPSEKLGRKSSYSSSSSFASNAASVDPLLDLCPSDALLPDLLRITPIEQIDANNHEARQHNRQNYLFALYPQQAEEEQVEYRQPAEVPSDHVPHRILVKCMQFKLDLEIEPIFASAALYDLQVRKRISENFYFDLNGDNLHQLIRDHVPHKDLSTMSTRAIFDITFPSYDIFIVIKLEKVLQQGEISEVVEPYIIKDEKLREKARVNAQHCCSRLGKHRMPFAWTGIHLMNTINNSGWGEGADKDSIRSDSLERSGLSKAPGRGSSTYINTPDKRNSWNAEEIGNALDTFRPITITVNNFYKQEADKLSDDDLFKFLSEMKKQASALKKLKPIPGILKLDLSSYSSDLTNVLTTELNPVDPFIHDTSKPSKEVLEFPTEDIYKPHTFYRNLMFVYPKFLNFANRQGSARNIAVKVQFMHGEGDNNALPVIYGKSNCPAVSKEAYTTVNYHNKTPSFYDEIKINLPGRLTDSHHLFFTMYHVSCQPKKDAVDLETIVGYSWLPLFRDGHLVTGEFNLPVSLDLPPQHYHMLHPDVQLPSMKWVDNHRGLFNVVINAVSSIHTLDEHLDKFLSLVNAADEGKIPSKIGEACFEDQLKKCVSGLTETSTGPLVRYVHLVLDKLLQLLIRPPVVAGQVVNVGQESFDVVAHIVRRLQHIRDLSQDKHGRNSILVSYIIYTCTLQPSDASTANTSVGSNQASPGTGLSGLTRPMTMSTTSRSGRTLSCSDPDVSNIINEQDAKQMEAGKQEYLKFVNKKFVHEELVLQWLVSTGKTSSVALSNSWFFLELIVRSMEDHLGRTNKLNAPRKTRFPAQFLLDISSLVEMISKKIVESSKILDEVSIQGQNTLVNKGTDTTGLLTLKLEFMRIVCSHEHYFTLNLPFNVPSTPSAPPSPTFSIASSASQASLVSSGLSSCEKLPFIELTNEYKSQHFLAGIVLSDLVAMLETNVSQLQIKSINLVSNLIASHDMDPRFRSSEAKSRVATLYLPIVKIVIDILLKLFQPSNDSKNRCPESAAINQSVALAIAGSASYNLNPEQIKRNHLSQESTQDLLICFLWVLKNANIKLLWMWWSNLTPATINQLLEILKLAISNFEYKYSLPFHEQTEANLSRRLSFNKTASPLRSSYSEPVLSYVANHQYFIHMTLKANVTTICVPHKKEQNVINMGSDFKSKMEEYMLGPNSARMEMIRRKQHESTGLPLSDGGSKLRWRKDQIHYKQSNDLTDGNKNREESDGYVEGLLSSEVNMVALDVIEFIIQVVQSFDMLQSSLSNVLQVILHGLSTNQSSTVLQNMFATQRSLVSKFPELLFEEDTEQCADLCSRLLKHCSSSLASIRSHASASLYMLMRQNYEIGNNFARVKMQVTMSLSSLVGQTQAFNEEHLRTSLKTILLYADSDEEFKDTAFPEQVRELVKNLHMILSDTIKMKEYHSDPEMLLDLMYRIARGYQNSPDLRLTWLDNMASKHKERKNYAEAAQCMVHAAGLVAEYLNMLEDKSYLPVGCVALQHVSRNVLEESAVSEDVVSPDEEGICTGKYFTENGLTVLLEQSATFFEQASMYEGVNNVYKVLIPIYESNREFTKLAKIHAKIHAAFTNIIKHESKRMFGTYFRVGFYGSRFCDMDGLEFVYKEPAITKLSEISHRLETFYSEKFGSVEMIKDSNNVDKNQLNPDKAYIQITYVEPYFDLYELKGRQTFFEMNYNIKRFMYATPFTMDGKAHGELREQYKRKTILTTSHAFPYVKTRLEVVNKESFTLSPIEVAIEDIQKKTKELALALKQDPPDAKMLQMVLQGCIGATVNQGPIELASVFLSPLMDGALPTKHHNKLRSCFKDFMKKLFDSYLIMRL